jgi:hypothetical protein
MNTNLTLILRRQRRMTLRLLQMTAPQALLPATLASQATQTQRRLRRLQMTSPTR